MRIYSLLILLSYIASPKVFSQGFRGEVISKTIYDKMKTSNGNKIQNNLAFYAGVSVSEIDTVFTKTLICSDTVLSITVSQTNDLLSKDLYIGSNHYIYNSTEGYFFPYNTIPHCLDKSAKKDFKKLRKEGKYNYLHKSKLYKDAIHYLDIDRQVYFKETHTYSGLGRFFSPLGIIRSINFVNSGIVLENTFVSAKYNICPIDLNEYSILDELREESMPQDTAVNNFELKFDGMEFDISEISPVFNLYQPISLEEELGDSITLVDFWATWCQPCLKQKFDLIDLHEKFKNKGLKIISVSIDKLENYDYLIEWINSKNYPWEQFYLKGDKEANLAIQHDIKFLPRLMLLDKYGRIINDNCPPASSYNLEKLIELTLDKFY